MMVRGSAAFYRQTGGGTQRGLVLLITLLVLMVMMLASIGMMRSVDTSTLAVANMAFRQAAVASANQAIEVAIRRLANGTDLAGEAADGNVPGSGYFAWYDPAQDDPRGIPDRRIKGGGVVMADKDTANTTATVIERMCTAAGAVSPPEVVCLTTGETLDSESKTKSGNEARDDAESNADTADSSDGTAEGGAILYRISTRVDGPSGTVAYAQAMVARGSANAAFATASSPSPAIPSKDDNGDDSTNKPPEPSPGKEPDSLIRSPSTVQRLNFRCIDN